MKCLTIMSLVAVIATAGCLSNKSAKNEKVQPEAKAGEVKPAPEKPVEEWVAKPEMIFGAALGTKIDAEMKAAGVKADLPDRDSMAEVYHLACSAFRDPNFKFKPIGKLCPRHGFYPCQIWVNRQTRDIEQIFASPIEGAKDEDREKMGWELCKRFQPSFGKAKIGRAGKNVIWLFEFKDSKGFQCRAVLRTEKSKRDGLWSYHIMVFRVIKYVTQARKEEPKKPIAPFKRQRVMPSPRFQQTLGLSNALHESASSKNQMGSPSKTFFDSRGKKERLVSVAHPSTLGTQFAGLSSF